MSLLLIYDCFDHYHKYNCKDHSNLNLHFVHRVPTEKGQAVVAVEDSEEGSVRQGHIPIHLKKKQIYELLITFITLRTWSHI